MYDIGIMKLDQNLLNVFQTPLNFGVSTFFLLKQEEHRKVSRADSLKAVLWAQSSLRGEPKHFNVSTINEEEETIKSPISSDSIEKGIENSQQKKQHRPIVNKRSIKMSQKHSTAIGTPSEVAMLNYAAILINVHKCRQEYEDANCLIKKYLEINPSLYSCSN